MKFNFKKIAPIFAGAILLGSTIGVAGAFAAEAYPASFADAVVVVGATASADNAPANLIAADIASKTGTSTVTVSGGKTEDITITTKLNASDVFGNNIDESDVSGLLDTMLSIDMNDVEDDYDVHDEIVLNKGTAALSVETGLTYNADEDWKANVFMPITRSSIGYYYVFDDALTTGNFISNASSTESLTIEFLGKALEVSGATATTMTVTVGEEQFLNVDDSVVVNGKTVKLLNVGQNDNVVVSVDGVQETVSGTETVNGLKVKVKDTFYSDAKTERSATIIIGEDATKTYSDGDAYIGEDEDDPNWVWDLAGLTGGSPTIGILYDQVKDDPSDNPPMIGGSISLPGNYATIKLDSLTVKDYQMYEVETTTEEVYNASGGTGAPYYDSSLGVIHISGAGSDDSFEVSGGDDTDDVYLGLNGTITGGMHVYWKDPDDNKIKYTGTTIANGSIINDTGIDISFKDTSIAILATLAINGQAGNITLPITGDDIAVNFKYDSGNDINYLGASDSDTTTTADLRVGTRDISGWEEDTMTAGGIIIKDPDSHLSGDSFEFDINGDESDFKVNVVVAGPGAISGGGVVPVMKDSALGSLKATKNLVVVGGSAVNTVAADLLNVPEGTFGTSSAWQSATGVSENMAIIKLFSGTESLGTGTKALLVAGYNAKDTQAAAKYLTTVGEIDKVLSTATSEAVVSSSI